MPILLPGGDIGEELQLFEANSIYCSTTGPRGSIYGVTRTQQEQPVDGVLVMVLNQDINVSQAFLTQYSKCPPPGPPAGVAALPECFRFDNLPAGIYAVVCVGLGDTTYTKTDIVVTEGGQTYVDCPMAI